MSKVGEEEMDVEEGEEEGEEDLIPIDEDVGMEGTSEEQEQDVAKGASPSDAPAAAAPAAAAPATAAPAAAAPTAAPGARVPDTTLEEDRKAAMGSLRNAKDGTFTELDARLKREETDVYAGVKEVGDDSSLPKVFDDLRKMLEGKDGLLRIKVALRTNMRLKNRKYRSLREDAKKLVEQEEERLAREQRSLMRRSYADQGSLSRGERDKRGNEVFRGGDNLKVYEMVAGESNIDNLYKLIYKCKEIEEESYRILNEADGGKIDVDGIDEENDKEIIDRRNTLVELLDELSCFYRQKQIVEEVCNTVVSFIKSPSTFEEQYLNMILMGGPGTGKTSIARVASKIYSACGMFVYKKTIECGRGQFIAPYLGQTEPKTTGFMVNALDNGVVFLDEAYALTAYQHGQLDGYSTESVDALTQFMSTYQGLYCMIAAGYEKPMKRHFLAANVGLSRRFPNKFLLNPYTTDDLVLIFKRRLLKRQGLVIRGCREEDVRPADQYFSVNAWLLLKLFINSCQAGKYRTSRMEEYDVETQRYWPPIRELIPSDEDIYQFIEEQAGAMTAFGDYVSTIMIVKGHVDIIKKMGEAERKAKRNDGKDDLRVVWETRKLALAYGIKRPEMAEYIRQYMVKTAKRNVNTVENRTVAFLGSISERMDAELSAKLKKAAYARFDDDKKILDGLGLHGELPPEDSPDVTEWFQGQEEPEWITEDPEKPIDEEAMEEDARKKAAMAADSMRLGKNFGYEDFKKTVRNWATDNDPRELARRGRSTDLSIAYIAYDMLMSHDWRSRYRPMMTQREMESYKKRIYYTDAGIWQAARKVQTEIQKEYEFAMHKQKQLVERIGALQYLRRSHVYFPYTRKNGKGRFGSDKDPRPELDKLAEMLGEGPANVAPDSMKRARSTPSAVPEESQRKTRQATKDDKKGGAPALPDKVKPKEAPSLDAAKKVAEDQEKEVAKIVAKELGGGRTRAQNTGPRNEELSSANKRIDDGSGLSSWDDPFENLPYGLSGRISSSERFVKGELEKAGLDKGVAGSAERLG